MVKDLKIQRFFPFNNFKKEKKARLMRGRLLIAAMTGTNTQLKVVINYFPISKSVYISTSCIAPKPRNDSNSPKDMLQ